MRLDEFLDELWTVLDTVPGLNVPTEGAAAIGSPPAPYAELPSVTYGQHGHGLHGVVCRLVVWFGQPNNPEVFQQALEYASDEGTRSVPAALLAHEWETVHTVRAAGAEPIVDTINNHPALAYEFTLHITGAPA